MSRGGLYLLLFVLSILWLTNNEVIGKTVKKNLKVSLRSEVVKGNRKPPHRTTGHLELKSKATSATDGSIAQERLKVGCLVNVMSRCVQVGHLIVIICVVTWFTCALGLFCVYQAQGKSGTSLAVQRQTHQKRHTRGSSAPKKVVYKFDYLKGTISGQMAAIDQLPTQVVPVKEDVPKVDAAKQAAIAQMLANVKNLDELPSESSVPVTTSPIDYFNPSLKAVFH